MNEQKVTSAQNLLAAYARGDKYFTGANLGGAYLRGAYLRGANLGRADLRGAYLRGANLGGADLRGADLRGAKFDLIDLAGAWQPGAYVPLMSSGNRNLQPQFNLNGLQFRTGCFEGTALELRTKALADCNGDTNAAKYRLYCAQIEVYELSYALWLEVVQRDASEVTNE